MSETNRIAATAALIGDPARANILAALLDGRALTAKELAYTAHVTPQTASGHLAKLADGGLLTGEKQGRHRYFRLASPLVGQMLEGVMAVAGPEPARAHHLARREALRTARTCYDHMAGTARRGAGGCADRTRACGVGGGWRRSHRAGRAVSAGIWRGAGGWAARVLPALPGLERAAAASGGAGGGGAGVPVLGAWMDRAATGHPRGGDYGGGAGGVPRDFRDRAGRVSAGNPRIIGLVGMRRCRS